MINFFASKSNSPELNNNRLPTDTSCDGFESSFSHGWKVFLEMIDVRGFISLSRWPNNRLSAELFCSCSRFFCLDEILIIGSCVWFTSLFFADDLDCFSRDSAATSLNKNPAKTSLRIPREAFFAKRVQKISKKNFSNECSLAVAVLKSSVNDAVSRSL